MMKAFAISTVLVLATLGCATDDETAAASEDDAGTLGDAASPAALTVAPEAFDFGRVAPTPPTAGEPAPFVELTVANAGGTTLHLAGLTLSGDAAFTPLVNGEDPRGPEGAGALADPDEDGAPGLSPGAAFVVEVHYAPTTAAPASAVLTLESDDPERPSVTVSLTAGGD